MTTRDLQSADAFSDEVHFALLTEGLRGPLLRKLMRLSRADADLARIYDAKVGAYRRFHRESRKPTLWNLPLRGLEWLSDHARVTPPREVFMTLVYVVLAMAALETYKNHIPRRTLGLATADTRFAWERTGAVTAELGLPDRLDQWMVDELRLATQTDAWREALCRELAAGLRAADADGLLRSKLEEVVASPEFASRLSESVVKTALEDCLRSDAFKARLLAMIEEAIQKEAPSSAEKRSLAAGGSAPIAQAAAPASAGAKSGGASP